jgi:hypothetical protein
MLDRVPQEHKDRANDHFDRGKKFLTEEYFPKERRDQFIYRFKKVRVFDSFSSVVPSPPSFLIHSHNSYRSLPLPSPLLLLLPYSLNSHRFPPFLFT